MPGERISNAYSQRRLLSRWVGDVFRRQIRVEAGTVFVIRSFSQHRRRRNRHEINLCRSNVDYLGNFSKRDVRITDNEDVPVSSCSKDVLQAVSQFVTFLILGVQSEDAAGKYGSIAESVGRATTELPG